MKFKNNCERISEETNIGVVFYEYPIQKLSIYEDDGYLHIAKRGLRACFDVGQGQRLNGREQNDRTRLILEQLQLHIPDSALVDEDEDEDEDEW